MGKDPRVRHLIASAVQHGPISGWEINVAVSMEKLLATVIQIKASDLHISIGQPPVVRLCK